MYTVGKYKGKWAIFDTVTKVWYFTTGGKKGAEAKAKALNSEA